MSPAELIEDDDLSVLEDWDDLYRRGEKAANGLALLADQKDDPWDHERLLGKVDGVRLVLSFMREYRRPA